jgi:hypothetical protein
VKLPLGFKRLMQSDTTFWCALYVISLGTNCVTFGSIVQLSVHSLETQGSGLSRRIASCPPDVTFDCDV